MNIGNQMLSNAFKQGDARGRLDEKVNLNVLTCKVNDATLTATTALTAGDMVKLVSGGKKTVAKVVATETYSANTKYGFVPLARKQNSYLDKDYVSVAFSGSVMKMVAKENISNGDVVAFYAINDTDFGKVIKNPTSASAGKVECGVALEDVVAGDLVDVLIK